jgi:serine/threonine protein kinase
MSTQHTPPHATALAEYCDHGTLTAYAATAVKDPCEERQLLQLLVLLQDAARGLVALHSKNVVHGDGEAAGCVRRWRWACAGAPRGGCGCRRCLTPRAHPPPHNTWPHAVNARNVLVSSCDDAPGGVVAKLADLGMSRVLRQHATHKTTNTVGTLSHMPPELLRHGRISPGACAAGARGLGGSGCVVRLRGWPGEGGLGGCVVVVVVVVVAGGGGGGVGSRWPPQPWAAPACGMACHACARQPRTHAPMLVTITVIMLHEPRVAPTSHASPPHTHTHIRTRTHAPLATRARAAVDIYSFGIMMWECWTGQPAFRHLHYGQFFGARRLFVCACVSGARQDCSHARSPGRARPRARRQRPSALFGRAWRSAAGVCAHVCVLLACAASTARRVHRAQEHAAHRARGHAARLQPADAQLLGHQPAAAPQRRAGV